jgi:hypothetical protein
VTAPRLTAAFDSPEAFALAHRSEISAGGLLIHGAQLENHAAVGPCRVELRVAGHPPVEVEAQLAAAVPGVGVAVIFPDRTALDALAERMGHETPGKEPGAGPPVPGTTGARLQVMTVAEKMQSGLSGDRDVRSHLLRDTNKALHLYVLRNPRIGLDEVQYAARLSTLSPDALKFIAEHREWSLNPAVCAALARNPKTPIPMVLRILSRVPVQDLRALAKGGGRMPIVQAARKLLSE